MRGLWLGILGGLATASAGAGELTVNLTDQRGKPVGDAVVMVELRSGTAPKPPPRRIKTINQVALTFVPYIQVFRPGDQVMFHNSDKTRHHVYSFSPIKSFEFTLNPGQNSPLLRFDKNGVVAVGCNIHDPMITYLVVSDAPWTVRSGADGKTVVSELPAGSYTVRVWQPRLRPGLAAPSQPLVITATGDSKSLKFVLPLLPDSRRKASREQSGY